MRVTVLGGSAAGTNTGQGCSGFLVETGRGETGGGTRVVLDLGPGTVPELRRHTDYRTLDAVVLSHLHLDHTLDVAALRWLLAYNPRPALRPVPLWLPPGGRAFLTRLASAFAEPGAEEGFFDAVFAVAEYDPSRELAVGDATLTFAPTVHYVPCWAVRVGAGGPPLAYTADTGPAADLSPVAGGAGLLIAEATLPEPPPDADPTRGHLSASEAAAMAAGAGASRLLLTHVWEEYGLESYAAAARAHFAGPVEVARPGLQVAW